MLAVPARLLKKWLGKLKNDNAQREYYLTDIIAMAVKDKVKVRPLIASPATEGAGSERQGAAGRSSKPRARQQICARADAGGRRRWQTPRASICAARSSTAAMSSIDVNVVLEGKVKLGDRVRIGPNCFIRDA